MLKVLSVVGTWTDKRENGNSSFFKGMLKANNTLLFQNSLEIMPQQFLDTPTLERR